MIELKNNLKINETIIRLENLNNHGPFKLNNFISGSTRNGSSTSGSSGSGGASGEGSSASGSGARGDKSHRQLIDCIRGKDTDALLAAVSSGAVDVNFTDDVGQTLLNWASAFGTREMVEFLCEKGELVLWLVSF